MSTQINLHKNNPISGAVSPAKPNERYLVMLNGEAQIWDANRYNKNAQKLYADHPEDALTFKLDDGGGDLKSALRQQLSAMDGIKDEYAESISAAQSYEDLFNIPGLDDSQYLVTLGSEQQVWDAKRLQRNGDKLMSDHPDAQIAQLKYSDYWYNTALEDEETLKTMQTEIDSLKTEFANTQEWSPEAKALQAQINDKQSARDALQARYNANPRVIEANKRYQEEMEAAQANLPKELRSQIATAQNRMYQESKWIQGHYDYEGYLVPGANPSVPEHLKPLLGEDGKGLPSEPDELKERARRTPPPPMPMREKRDNTRVDVETMSRGGSGNRGETVANYNAAAEFLDSYDYLVENRSSVAQGAWYNMVTSPSDEAIEQVSNVMKKLESACGNLNEVTPEDIEKALTSSEQTMLQSYFLLKETEEKTSSAFKGGEIAGEGLKIAGEMIVFDVALNMLLPGAGTAAGAASKLSKARKIASAVSGWFSGGSKVKKLASGALKASKFVAKQGVKAATFTALAPTTYSHIAEKKLQIDENGRLMDSDEDIMQYAAEELVENFTEFSGEGVAKLVGKAGKWAKGTKLGGKIAARMGNSWFGKAGQWLLSTKGARYLEKAGFQGLPIEVFEEFEGAVINQFTGLNENAIEEFADKDNLTTMLIGFAPMTLLGAGTGMGTYAYASNSVRRDASKLKKILLAEGFSEGQADYLINYERQLTPESLGKELHNVMLSMSQNGASSKSLKAVTNYAKSVGRYKAMDGILKTKDSELRKRKQAELDAKYGTHIGYRQSDSQSDESVVTTATLLTRQKVYITSEKNEAGEYLAIDMESGESIPITDEDIGVITDENGNESAAVNTRSYETYLAELVMADREQKEQQRMQQETVSQISALQEQLKADPKLNIGTSDAPVIAVFQSGNAQGAEFVLEDGTTKVLTWNEVGDYLGQPIRVLSDAEIAEAEAAALEAEEAKRRAENAKTNEDMDKVDELVEDAETTEEVVAPTNIPMNPDGTVNTDLFWDQNPEEWVKWNDQQKQDGGVDSMAQVAAGLQTAEAKLAEASKMPFGTPTQREARDQEMGFWQDKINRYNAILEQYQMAEEIEESEDYAVADAQQELAQQPSAAQQILRDLYSDESLSEEEIESYINANVEGSQKDLDKHLAKAPKMGRDMAKYKQEKAAFDAKTAELQAERDLWREVAAYVSAPQVEMDMEPQNALELAAYELSLKDGGIKILPESFRRHTGYGMGEQVGFLSILRTKQKGGISMEAAGERLMEIDRENATGFFDQSDPNAGLNTLLELLSSVKSSSEIRNYILGAREELAQQQTEAVKGAIIEQITQEQEDARPILEESEVEGDMPMTPQEASAVLDAMLMSGAKRTDGAVVDAMQDFADAIAVGVPAKVVTRKNVIQTLKEAGVSERKIAEVKDALRRIQYIVNGFEANGVAYVLADDVITSDDIRGTYVHERQHIMTAQSGLDAALMTMTSREELQDAISKLTNSNFYNGKGHMVLADELISMAMERAYKGENLDEVFERIGLKNENAINFIKSIDNAQRNDSGLSLARVAEIGGNTAEGGSGQDGRTEVAGSTEVGEQGTRPSGRGGEATGDNSSRRGVGFSVTQSIDRINNQFNAELQQQIDGTLPVGHVYQLGMPSRILRSTGIADAPIQLNSTRLEDKAKNFGHDFDLSEIKDLVNALQSPMGIFAYGDKSKAQNIVVEIQHNGQNFIVGLAIKPTVNGRVLDVNSIRNVFPKDNAEWLNWISQNKALYLDKEKIQGLIDQQRTNLADVEYLDLDSIAKIVENFENPSSEDARFSVITPQMDADYLAAVERGDMETAQRMVLEAAKLAMPNTAMIDRNGYPKIFYHNTDAEFTAFGAEYNGTASDAGWLGDGFYFYGDPTEGDLYGRNKMQVFLNIEEPYYATSEENKFLAEANSRKESIAFSERLKEEWYDGVYYNGDLRQEAVAFYPSQIKSADPVTYDDNGNVIPISERFNPENEDIRFSIANENQAIFVSNAARAVEAIKMEKATPEQWLAMIEKNGGLKAGEDKWMGLSDWLKASKAKTLTKAEVLDFINENMIIIEEQHYAGNAEADAENTHAMIERILQEKFGNYIAEYYEQNNGEDDNLYGGDSYEYAMDKLREEMNDEFPYTIERSNSVVYLTFPYEETDDLQEWADKLGVKFAPQNPINTTRLAYTTRGLANLHEIALIIPTIEPWNESDDVHFGDAGEGRAVAWIRLGETEVPVRDAAYYTRLQEIYDRLNELEMKGPSFTSITPEEYKERSRLRKERDELQKTYTKTQRVLVIDEIQSKRHQEGREKGYTTKEDVAQRKAAIARAKKATNDLYDYIGELVAKYPGTEYSLERVRENRGRFTEEENNKLTLLIMEHNYAELELEKHRGEGVPDAPFDKNWHELAMKRMLRYAAENGYDVIAWTKGEQQAERYNIGNYVSSIEMQEEYDGNRDFGFYMGDSDEALTVTVDENGTVVSAEDHLSQAEGRPLADLVGKEMAVKMMQMEEYDVLEDTDLNIGNKGMKGFYDRMLPAFMNKYGKKWGVKVEDINLPGLENGLTMHSVPVTEEMKSSVMEGQVMFSVGNTPISPEVRAEMDVIAATAMVNGNYMLAPNGQPTRLTADQWAMVRTKNFINWFGDWENDPENASKVVDENGEPMVVYHGTQSKFTAFDVGYKGKNFGFRLSDGFYFSPDETVAESYASFPDELKTGEVKAVFLNIINPFHIKSAKDYREQITEIVSLAARGNRYQADLVAGMSESELLSQRGYDGVVEKRTDGVTGEIVVFEPSQIKSATDNTGEFSESEDIRFSSRFDVNTNPTEAQKKAGNYKMGHLRLDGYNITIENPKGSIRRGTDSKGNAWENTLNNDYGYIRGTEGVDGDHIDVYLSDNPAEGNVFVIDQVNPETREFDEHKVMYGFSSMDEAREAYLANFSKGWNGLGTITKVTKDEFRKWIDSSHRKTKPFSEYKSVKTAILDEGDIRFSVSEIPVDEIVNEGVQKVSEEGKKAKTSLKQRMDDIDSKLYYVMRMVAAAQKNYDKKTVDIMTNLAKDLLRDGALSDPTRGEINRLLAAIKNATGKADLTKSATALLDVMVSNQLRHSKEMFKQMLSIKTTKVNTSGVEVQGRLDLVGQRLLSTIKGAIGLTPEQIEDRIAEAKEKLDEDSDVVVKNAQIDLTALNLAKQYVNGVTASQAEEKDLRHELETAEESKKNGTMTAEGLREFRKATEDAIRQNRLERTTSYRSLLSEMARMIAESFTRAGNFRDAEKERVERIHHFANSDMQGLPATALEEKTSAFWNSPFTRVFLAPFSSFEQWMKRLGSKNAEGKGYLYNHFIPAWINAANNEYLGVREAYDVLDAKAREVFGKGVKRWSDLFSKEKKMATMTVKIWDDGEMRDYELSQGNLLYIYMVNKMTDGKMKLRRMGITEEDVRQIYNNLDPRFIEIAEWIQNDFLPSLRDKYNAVHEKMFGAPMAAIDNYFPIRVHANARIQNDDLGNNNTGSNPATITGSIIKRTKNSLALDVLGSDAFDVVLEHIQQMEHWAAFAEFNKDLNTLLSYKKFRNRVQNMSGIYGTGKDAWKNFRETAEMVAGVYRPKASNMDSWISKIIRGLTSGKIGFRLHTAMKQFLSAPAFLPYSAPHTLVKNMARPINSWKWAMKNLPGMKKRWGERDMGNIRLKKVAEGIDRWTNNWMDICTRLGMTPNAFVDALTCSIGAKSVYETTYAKYKKDGYSHEDADRKAKIDATIVFNATQQSSESAFLSTLQADRDMVAYMTTTYRNANFGMQRELIDALRNFKHRMTPGYKEESIEFMTKQMIRDGVSEENARRAAERVYRTSVFKDSARIATFGFLMQFLWNMGGSIIYLFFGDDDEEKQKIVEDAAFRGMFGSVENLTFGNLVVDGIMLAREGEFEKFNPHLSPAGQDIARFWEVVSSDLVGGASDLINIMSQIFTGANLQVAADAAIAIYDACDGDLELSKEVGIALLRIIQAPQSQVDKLIEDEIDFTKDKGLDMTIEEFARNYASYKKRRNAPYTFFFYDDEQERKVEDKYIKRFTKRAEELKRTRGSETAKAWYDYVDNEYKEVSKTISELRRNIVKARKRGDEVGAYEFAEALRDFMETPEAKRYRKRAGRVKLEEKLRNEMKDRPQRRDELEDRLLSVRRQLVEEMQSEE